MRETPSLSMKEVEPGASMGSYIINEREVYSLCFGESHVAQSPALLFNYCI